MYWVPIAYLSAPLFRDHQVLGMFHNTMFVPGQLYRRRDLHEQFGSQQQGGISTPAKAPFVMLIAGDSGNRYGYVDQWTNDGLFAYTGEGQKGPMRFVSGNKAIRDHKVSGKSLQLFQQDKKDKRMLLYLGEMEYADHEIQPAARQGQKSQGCHYL